MPECCGHKVRRKRTNSPCRCKSDPVQNTVTEHSYHVSRETRLLHLSTTVHVFPWSINVGFEYEDFGPTCRRMGAGPQIDTNGRFIMNEAWAKLNFGAGFFAQLGRQTLSYDDERILGGLDWNVAGRYHDALKLGYARMPTNCISFLPSTRTRKRQKAVPIIMTVHNLIRICRPFGIIMRRKPPTLMSLCYSC